MIAPKSPSASGDAAYYYSGGLESTCATGTAMASREHSQGGNQHSLRLLLPHRPATPAPADRPLSHAPLQADDVPDAATGRAGETAQRLHRLVHPTLCMKLPFALVRLATRARHPQHRQRAERVELGDDERGLKVLGGI